MPTDTGLGGDLLFLQGGLVEPVVAPVGASFEERGMRNDQHDAVGATLTVPIREVPSGAPQAVGGGAPQPADGGTPEHAVDSESSASASKPLATFARETGACRCRP
eukprot:5166833-Lingulodinium_polyedra.AAC.1